MKFKFEAECGKAHFEELDEVEYRVVSKVDIRAGKLFHHKRDKSAGII